MRIRWRLRCLKIFPWRMMTLEALLTSQKRILAHQQRYKRRSRNKNRTCLKTWFIKNCSNSSKWAINQKDKSNHCPQSCSGFNRTKANGSCQVLIDTMYLYFSHLAIPVRNLQPNDSRNQKTCTCLTSMKLASYYLITSKPLTRSNHRFDTTIKRGKKSFQPT